MPRLRMMILSVAAGVAAVSCASSHSAKTSQTGSNTGDKEHFDEQFETPPPRDSVPEVMQAKLAHSQAVLEGLVLADFAQVETNAMALQRISEGSDWLVHDSATYFEFSAEFRRVCDDMINHARARDVRAAARDYANLTNSCVACHEFLRAERQSKDMPGRMSLLLDTERRWK